MTDFRYSGIYEIVHRPSQKRYIGSAVNIRRRWLEHKSQLRRVVHHSPYLQNSFIAYGEKEFDFLVIEKCEKENLIVREQFYIDSMAPEFNMSPTAGNTMGRFHSEETKKKISEKAKGRKCAPRSKEHREALSNALSGKQKSPEHMAKLQEGRKNRVFTEDQRAALSNATRERIATGSLDVKKTEEQSLKIAETLSRFTREQIQEIYRLRLSGVPGAELSRKYGMCQSTICQMMKGKKHQWAFK